MRMSCNGCRVLRKGCSGSCVLRPCLYWIRTAESQANATIFLAKFYGRNGLMNLISNGPEHLRPAIFRSLLYEACGRMVNPIHGSLGLLCSGNWTLCQAGVESILQGSLSAVPMEAMACRKLYRPVKARGRFKGLLHSKPREKKRDRDRAPLNSDMDSGSKSNDWGDVRNVLQKAADNGEFNEKCLEKYSMFFSGKELGEFVAADQREMEQFHDLCNLGTIQAEASSCNAVGLELTLGSQCSTS